MEGCYPWLRISQLLESSLRGEASLCSHYRQRKDASRIILAAPPVRSESIMRFSYSERGMSDEIRRLGYDGLPELKSLLYFQSHSQPAKLFLVIVQT